MCKKLQVTCLCCAYNFPHRIGGGACSGTDWAKSYREFDATDCGSCNCMNSGESGARGTRNNECDVIEGLESFKYGECYQAHLHSQPVERYPTSINEHQAFLAFIRQTFAYGKSSDPLTFGRISHLTGIRKDRVQKATDGVIDKGVFGMRDHKFFGQEFYVPDEFCTGSEYDFYSPTIPVNGEVPQQTEEKPTQRGHTVSTNTPSTLTPQQQPSEVEVKHDDESGGGFELPKEISKENQAACRKILASLSEIQRFNTLAVFGNKSALGGIRSPACYLRGLAKRAKEGTLTLPERANKPAPLHPSHKPISQSNNQISEEFEEQKEAYQGLVNLARMQNKRVEQIAEESGMNHVLDFFKHKVQQGKIPQRTPPAATTHA